MFKAINKTLVKYFVNEQGEISLTAVSAIVGTIAASVLIIPTMDLSFTIPAIIIDVAKIITAISAGGVVIGGRKAMKK